MKIKKNFSIVIPVFNEGKNIKILFIEINKFLKDYDYEVIFVNDFSSDSSEICIKNLISEYSNIKLINHKKNLGQSHAILSGVRNSKYETVITIDCDLQNNPKDIPNLIDAFFLSDNIKLVGGLRLKRKDNFIKIISSFLANKIRSRILDDKCDDTGCGLKVFSRDLFLSFPFFNGIHRFLPAMYRGLRYETLFLPVSHRPRIHGYSKYGTFKRLIKGIIDIIRVKIIIKKINSTNNK